MSEDAVTTSGFERHAQTAIQVMLLALVLWAGQQLVNTGNRMVALEVQVSALEQVISKAGATYYTQRDAERDLRHWSASIETCRENSRALVQRVNEIDQRLRNFEVMK